jgi:hypothetical protein
LNSWGNGHVAVDIVIMYIALLVDGRGVLCDSELRIKESVFVRAQFARAEVFDNR